MVFQSSVMDSFLYLLELAKYSGDFLLASVKYLLSAVTSLLEKNDLNFLRTHSFHSDNQTGV